MIRRLLRGWLFADEEEAYTFDIFTVVEGSPTRRDILRRTQNEWRESGLIQ